jgi:hypothetical protein
MKEQLITFETAKLANEKGLETTTERMYRQDGLLGHSDFSREITFRAPPQSLLQKWLREVHNINIFMSFKPNIKKWDFIPYSMDMNAKEYIKYNSEYTKIHNERRFDTYEEALEVGLQEALKLI